MVPHGMRSPFMQGVINPNFNYTCVPGGLWLENISIVIIIIYFFSNGGTDLSYYNSGSITYYLYDFR